MATRYINRMSGTGVFPALPGAVPFWYDSDDDLIKFQDDDGTTVRTVVTTAQTQTLTNKTLTSPTITSPTITGAAATLTVATVAAAGNAQANATAITAASGSAVYATGADGIKGVQLPAAAAGYILHLKNEDNAILKVYPASSDAINALAADASLDMAARTSMTIWAKDATTWYSIPLLPS